MGRHGARPEASLLSTAELQRRQLHALTVPAPAAAPRHQQRADALRTVHLVRRQRHEIDPKARKVDGDLADALRRIHVQTRTAMLRTDRAYGRNILDDADLVVDLHDGHQHRVRLQRRGDLIGVYHPGAVRRQVRDTPAPPLEFAARIEHRLVFRAGRDDVPAVLAVIPSDPENREVIGLGGTRRPNHLGRRGPHGSGHLRTRRLDQRTGGIAKRMARRRRIAELPLHGQALRHGRRHPRIDGGRCRMVQVHGPQRRPCTALNMPRRMLSSLRSS